MCLGAHGGLSLGAGPLYPQGPHPRSQGAVGGKYSKNNCVCTGLVPTFSPFVIIPQTVQHNSCIAFHIALGITSKHHAKLHARIMASVGILRAVPNVTEGWLHFTALWTSLALKSPGVQQAEGPVPARPPHPGHPCTLLRASVFSSVMPWWCILD